MRAARIHRWGEAPVVEDVPVAGDLGLPYDMAEEIS